VPEVGDCRVVVRVPGFEDLEVKLKHTTRLGDLALGDLTLKALGPESAVIFSAVARKAPGKARSGYIQALTSIGAGKYEEAVASLDKAIRAFPEYSSAFELKGEVLEQMGRREAARECYRQAIAADAGYGKPAVRLAEMAADDNNPEEAAKWAAMANRLAPGAFPKIYLIEGSAYFNLKRAEEAGRAAQAGIDADRKDMVPGLHRLLGEVLYAQKRYSAARGEFDRYLSDAPEAPDSGDVRAKAGTCEKLAKIEGR
jgi:tetratricopeptide (TPR) repeat protein